ncbi:MAG: hypothetical protein HY831_01120 [Candidatus Aenigmarchaeota archaeon]|nr:hypothetical protein [Candidatus Aenigmarchaeota archaeon]
MKEVELSAKISEDQFNFLNKKLSKDMEKTSSQKRFMIRFFKEKVDVRHPLDIRYKWTNGIHELVFKKGALGSQSREECIVNLGKQNQLEKFVNIFSAFGYDVGNAMYREREIFKNDSIEVMLVKVHPFFEMEVESINGVKKSDALKNIKNFFEEINIQPLNKADYQSFARLKDKQSNIIFKLKDFPKPLIENDKWRVIMNNTVLSNN